MVTTTREAAPAVHLNADWQAKYRQRAQQFLLQTQNSIAELQEGFTTKLLHHHHHQEIVDGKLSQDVHAKISLEEDAIHGELHGHSVQPQGYLLNLKQDAIDEELPSVCIVGRSGVGKSSLINHLLQERVSSISRVDANMEEHTFNYHGLFCIREIPGYDDWHAAEVSSHRDRLCRHLHRSSHGSHRRDECSSHSSQSSSSSHSSSSSSSHSSGGCHSSHSSGHSSNSSHTSKHGASHGKGRKLNLDEFVQMYRLFEDDTKAIIFVVNSRITPDDEKLMDLAVENRKFFCIVCTHADELVEIADRDLQKLQLDEREEQLRKDLRLLQSLNVRIFIVSIPFTEGQSRVGPDLKTLGGNIQELQFPLLQTYLSQPRGLLDELYIHSFVEEEVQNALEPFVNVKKRHQALDFSQHLVAGTLIPIVGPVMVSFLKTMRYTLKACSEVGLIENADDAMKKVSADANKHALSAKIASKEGMITAVHDSLIHIFGAVVFEIAIAEVVSTAAEAALHGALPLVGPVVSAAHLPSRFKKIGEKLASKACMLHELWIMQNITGLLGKA